jgi:hypothetical protein
MMKHVKVHTHGLKSLFEKKIHLVFVTLFVTQVLMSHGRYGDHAVASNSAIEVRITLPPVLIILVTTIFILGACNSVKRLPIHCKFCIAYCN